MSQLVPCPSCSRHHRVGELACPFCGLALPEGAPVPALKISRGRVSRATLIAAGAVWIGAGACDNSIAPPYGAAPPAPVLDASTDASDASTSTLPADAGSSDDTSEDGG